MTRPARVLALVTDAFGVTGGIAQYNRDFIAALAGGLEFESIDLLPRRRLGAAAGAPPGVRHHAPIYSRLGYSLRAIGLALLRRPQVVFCGHLYMAPIAAPIARLAGAKLVVQLHGVEIWTRPTRLQRRALEAADLVLCVSRDTRARAVAWAAIAPEKVVVVPNTVSDDYTPGDGAALRRRLGLADEIVLLTVGRLDPNQRHKGHERVMRLIGPARARGFDVVYLVVGEGADRARLEALALAQGVAEHVRFLGQAPPEDLPDLYRAADLYLMPSTGEGFGIVFLEAMACGTPALGLDVGGARDALSGLGEAVRDDQLEEALLRLLATGKPGGQAGLAARVKERFGRPAFQARVAEVMALVGIGPGVQSGAAGR